MNILLVDHHPETRQRLRDMLQGGGFTVIEAADGLAALELLQEQTTDLIISDVLMPGMDGFSLCREVKARPDTAGIPFIIYTSTYADGGEEELLAKIGADLLLPKTFDAGALITAIHELCERPQERPGGERDTDDRFYRFYAQRLIDKLEKKNQQLEEQLRAHRATLDELRRSENLLSITQSISKNGGWEWDAATGTSYWTDETFRLHGLESTGLSPIDQERIAASARCYPDEDRTRVTEAFMKCIQTGEPYDMHCRFQSTQGKQMHVRTAGQAIMENGRVTKVCGFIQDVTEIVQTLEEQKKLEEQLRQSQRLETVGRLAGGVAHDFNNLLSVILNYTTFATDMMQDDDPLKADLNEVLKAGERAAELTKQLLAFSRKQVIQPRNLNLNRIASEIEKMLRRVIGEDITLELFLEPHLDDIIADRSCMEQVLMNLVVNARDAMPDGGRLIIETHNIDIDEEYSARHVNVPPGPYVQLVVTDTGCGMDEETRSRIFEPFFTTKGLGKGTGLGLATVYGIVRQNGGAIWVYSEPGRGTTFKLYMPRASFITTPLLKPTVIAKGTRGTETIFVVEDEDVLRKLIHRVLSSAGYKVLVASGADDAIEQYRSHKSDIHLLLTDVILPGMSGKQLADFIKVVRADLKVLYMSGYTDNVIVHHGVLDANTNFLAKPFTALTLLNKVREVLDTPL